MSTTIGFIGLGSMGKAMATNLVKAGLDVHVWNRSSVPAEDLKAQGATVASEPRALGSAGDMVLSMLPNDAVTRAILIDSGVIAAMKPGSLLINMATVSIACALDLQSACVAAGIGYLSAPVLGRPDVAAAGALNILTAGPTDLIARAQSVFDVLGQKTWVFGDRPEQANAVKLSANFMIANAIGAMGEACAVAGGYGVEKGDFLDLMTSTLFSAPVYRNYGASFVKDQYVPAGFKLVLGLKDVRLTMDAAEAVLVPTPLASALRDVHVDCLSAGQAEWDWASLAKAWERPKAQ